MGSERLRGFLSESRSSGAVHDDGFHRYSLFGFYYYYYYFIFGFFFKIPLIRKEQNSKEMEIIETKKLKLRKRQSC